MALRLRSGASKVHVRAHTHTKLNIGKRKEASFATCSRYVHLPDIVASDILVRRWRLSFLDHTWWVIDY